MSGWSSGCWACLCEPGGEVLSRHKEVPGPIGVHGVIAPLRVLPLQLVQQVLGGLQVEKPLHRHWLRFLRVLVRLRRIWVLRRHAPIKGALRPVYAATRPLAARSP